MSADVKLDTRRLDQLRAEIEPRAMALLDLAAFNIQAGAMLGARVDTGAMRASIYVEGASGGKGYDQALSAANSAAAARGRKVYGAPRVQARGKFERVIGVAVAAARRLRADVVGHHARVVRPCAEGPGTWVRSARCRRSGTS